MEKVGIDDVISSGATIEDLEALPRKDLCGERPTINADNKDLMVVSQEAWLALQAANIPPRLFNAGGLAARVATDTDGNHVLQGLMQDRLCYELGRAAYWYIERKKGCLSTFPPNQVVRDLLATPEPPLPRLTRIVEAPVFSSGGELQCASGYHAKNQTFFAPAPHFAIPSIPKIPSAEQITAAKRFILEELLGDFPFVEEADRAHAVAMILLPFARDLIAGPTPLHLVEKPTPGTGASLLTEVTSSLFLGRACSTLTEGRDEDEWRKRLTAKLREGPAIVLIDNLRRCLESSALSAAITTPTWEDRILGQSEMLRMPVRCVWIATGNNPSLSAEMARRTIRIRIDAKRDKPWLRGEFRHPNLREWATGNRSEIVASCLTLIQAWVAAGRPEGTAILGSFEKWSKVIGGILQFVEIPGFLANLSEFYELGDAEGGAWGDFVAWWWEKYRDAKVGVAELYCLLGPNTNPLDLGLGDGNERSQRTRLGKRLRELRDRHFGDYRIAQAGKKQGAQLWQLLPNPAERNSTD